MSAPIEKLLRDARIDLILGRIEKDQSVINEVITHLDSEIRSVKFNSIFVLGELGPSSVKAIAKITNCLKDDDWSICREAVRALGKIGTVAEQSVPEIIKLLNDKEESIRKEAVIALGKIASSEYDSVTKIINALKDNSEEVRTEAAKTLGEIGSDAFGAIQDLTNSLKDVSWTVRIAAANAINQIGKGSTKAIPSLITALEDRDWRVRFRIVNTLAGIGQESVSSLLKVLNHKNPIVRKCAVEALGEMQIADPQIINNLTFLLKDTNESVRGKAADSLRSIGRDAVPALIKAIETSNSQMKKIIISALGGIGKDATESIPTMVDLLFNPDQKMEVVKKSMAFKVFETLSLIPQYFIYSLHLIKTFLKDPLSKKASIRVESARALGKIGIGSEDAINALGLALKDPKYIVRREVALSLGKLGSDSKTVIPVLIKTLDDRNPDVRWRASEALGVIGINTEEIISGLNGLLHDECDYVCESAINALDLITD